MELGHVDADKAYAATVEAGKRTTKDEEEGVWGLHHDNGSIGGAEGIVKTVHMNQYAE